MARPIERRVDALVSPLREFVRDQTVSAALLVVTALAGLYLANSPLAPAYHHIGHVPVGLNVGEWSMSKSVHHWVNDGLMALFFFVLGLEIKREILAGELGQGRRAMTVFAAAAGGVLAPVALYTVFNPAAPGAAGWAIPMATDTAFALGALALLGTHAPRGLAVFLAALAIVDDIAALLASAKVGVLVASAVAGTAGVAWLWLVSGGDD